MRFVFALLLFTLFIPVLTATADAPINTLEQDYCTEIGYRQYSSNANENFFYSSLIQLRSYGQFTGSITYLYWPIEFEAANAIYRHMIDLTGPVFRDNNRKKHALSTGRIPIGQFGANFGDLTQCSLVDPQIVDQDPGRSFKLFTHYQIWFAWNAQIGEGHDHGVSPHFFWPDEHPLDHSMRIDLFRFDEPIGYIKLTWNQLQYGWPAFRDILGKPTENNHMLYNSIGIINTSGGPVGPYGPHGVVGSQ